MAQNVLHLAKELLARHYRLQRDTPEGKWATLMDIVLERGRWQPRHTDSDSIDESALRTPRETAAISPARLADLLDQAGFPGRKAGLLCALAKWWLRNFGDNDADFAKLSLDRWQNDLRAIRGVNWELADRILLHVGKLAVYPLDRGSMRICARHGWMEIAAEYDEWQAFFAKGSQDADLDLALISEWFRRLGREFCGSRPKCDECPVKSLLPARGPLTIENVE
ncbi:MAG TPA: hypothetical protein VKU82_05400 [Planctomycetaceae bacterium]|nr:hypothetical protein [Planctomycetaceae bacterium]